MPKHVRAQIRAAAVAALQGLPSTADRVYAGRTRPLPAGHAASLLVYVAETPERSDTHSMGENATLLRSMTLTVEGRVQQASEPDDALDAIALEVEPAMINGPLLGGLAKEVTLITTTQVTRADGENHNGVISLDFRVVYITRERSPSIAA